MSTWVRRVLLVEDDPFSATLVASVLREHGFEVHACSDVAQARDEANLFDPDIAILDVHLGGEATGIQLGYVLERAHPEIALMYLTRYPDAITGNRRHREHLQGRVILDKDHVDDSQTLIGAIETAMGGHQARPPSVSDEQMAQLTDKQLSVLGLIAEGLTNSAIAERRGTSERAVEKLIEAIYMTLGIQVRGDHNARVLAALRYAEVRGSRGGVAPEKNT
jgi:DNA-binding NarL/FixJ family response regulator